MNSGDEGVSELVSELWSHPDPAIASAALRHGFVLKVEGASARAKEAIQSGPVEVARSGIEGLAGLSPEVNADYWEKRKEKKIREPLWLDLFLALQASSDEASQKMAADYSASDPKAVFQLSESGGDPARGELVFRNQGACLQCHKIGDDGGIQGPVLTKVAERLTPHKLVESLVDPNAEIAKGYGLSSVTLKDGSIIMGRIPDETDSEIKVVAIDGKETVLDRSEVESVTPPVSAMPPLGASLPPRDLRDLVAFLASQKGKGSSGAKDAESHGEKDENIAK